MTVTFLRNIVGILLQQRRWNKHFNGREVPENLVPQVAQIRIEAGHVVHREVGGVNDTNIVLGCRKVTKERLKFLQREFLLRAGGKVSNLVAFEIARVAYGQDHAVLYPQIG